MGELGEDVDSVRVVMGTGRFGSVASAVVVSQAL